MKNKLVKCSWSYFFSRRLKAGRELAEMTPGEQAFQIRAAAT